jgi:hypothetical protein
MEHWPWTGLHRTAKQNRSTQTTLNKKKQIRKTSFSTKRSTTQSPSHHEPQEKTKKRRKETRKETRTKRRREKSEEKDIGRQGRFIIIIVVVEAPDRVVIKVWVRLKQTSLSSSGPQIHSVSHQNQYQSGAGNHQSRPSEPVFLALWPSRPVRPPGTRSLPVSLPR